MIHNFNQHIQPFAQKLSSINAHTITTNAYASQYLQQLFQHKQHYLHMYAMVLNKAFNNTTVLPQNATLVDFGCGNGLLAMFAKYCGVHKVLACDTSQTFLQSAQALANNLSIDIDEWILGDETNLLQNNTNAINIVVGTDVIEHIYNLNTFFKNLAALNHQLTTVFTTASIAENYFKSKKLKALQIQDELHQSNALHSGYENNFSGLSFLNIRKQLIKNIQPQLSNNVVQLLATNTRGLAKHDIEVAVNTFVQTNKIPQLIQHPTNTCDPITASWTERLLTLKEYTTIYTTHNFNLKISFGFYNEFEGGIKSYIAKILNKLIRAMGQKAKYYSPFMLLLGTKAIKK